VRNGDAASLEEVPDLALEFLERVDWQNVSLHDTLTHDYHPWFGKFSPDIPKHFIQHLTKRGAKVLDPFCGCGTTLVEAVVAGRDALGVDNNPLGCLISRVKVTPLSNLQLWDIPRLLNSIRAQVEEFSKLPGQIQMLEAACGFDALPFELPEFHNRDYWFSTWALNELAIIKAHVQAVQDVSFREFLLVAFSRVIVYSSNQETESRYRRVVKRRKPLEIFRAFSNAVASMTSGMEQLMANGILGNAEVVNRDARYLADLPASSVDLIVTSPPYLNSWDYSLYHRFRFFWLGLDPRQFEETEIGRHLRSCRSEALDTEVVRYREDMNQCIGHLFRVLKPRGYFCIVNANSMVKKRLVDTSKMIVDLAEANGFQLENRVSRDVLGPHFGQRASLTARKIEVDGNHGQKTEDILVFKHP
jgi:DNA modification methylase